MNVAGTKRRRLTPDKKGTNQSTIADDTTKAKIFVLTEI